LLELTADEWDRVMNVNLKAVFFVLQATARRMRNQDLIAGSELRGKLVQTPRSPRIAADRPTWSTTPPAKPAW